jgi:hypothetical protein
VERQRRDGVHDDRRWEVRVAGLPPMTFWTTRVQNFKVGEVQVPNTVPGS